MKKNIYVIIDGQAGSCGKGKVCAEFALERNPELAITNNMPNAGHTCVVNGKKRIFRNIPVSCVNKNTALFLGAGSVIDMEVLEQEYENNVDILDDREIIAHPNIPIIEDWHKEEEKQKLKSGSTFKGGGACLANKIMRPSDLKTFKGYENIKVVSYDEYYKMLKDYLTSAKRILIEGSQGCDLDINHSGHYPYTTSRQISVAQMLADSGISPRHLKETIMVIRPFPIRISNITNIGKEIYSGDYGKSKELTWNQINIAAELGTNPLIIGKEDIANYDGLDIRDFTEFTTVTLQERRVFYIDICQLQRNIQINTPNSIYLNFFQHLSNEYENIKATSINFNQGNIYFNRYLREKLYYLEEELDVPIKRLGTGVANGSYIKVLKR